MADELLAAAAAALGAPPEIVMRSAQARASADGTAVEDILAAWAGGAPTAAATAPPSPPEEAAEPMAEPAGEPPVPAVAEQAVVQRGAAPSPAEQAAAAPTVVTVTRRVPITEMPAPLLEGRADHHGRLLLGIVALFLAGVLGAVVLPAFAEDTSGTGIVRTETAEVGRSVYVSEGCWYCHTQLVRPIVTDVHLGPVTAASDLGAELPTTAGVMRIGPDLADVGLRPISEDPAALQRFLAGDGEIAHQSYEYLSEGDLSSLIAYLQGLGR